MTLIIILDALSVFYKKQNKKDAMNDRILS